MRTLRVLGTLVLVIIGAVALLAVIAHFTARGTADAAPKVKPRPSGTPALQAPSSSVGFLSDITRKQARAALLTAADLPTTWHAITGGDSDPSGVTTVPPGCGDRPKGAVLARVSFSMPGSEVAPGGTLDETVVRPASGTPVSALTDLQKKLAGCLDYQASSVAGAANFELGALRMPALGDGTLAVAARARANLGEAAGTLYVTRNEVYVAAGPVMVRLVAVTFTDDLPGTSLQHLLEVAVTRLQQSAG